MSSTRKRTSPQNSSSKINDVYGIGGGTYDPNSSTPSIGETAKHLPPGRKGQIMRSVSPPGSKTRLSSFIYVLLLLTALLGSYYGYRVVQYKSSVGGWWSLLMGRKPAVMQGTETVYKYGMPDSTADAARQHADTVESHIEALAKALGMPTPELAAAIAGAVRAYVPPASLSSIKKAEPTGEAVKVMLEEPEDSEAIPAPGAPAGSKAGGSHGVVEGVVEGMASGFESFVGMEEP
ncbi:hypothetical protein D9613_010620 [Agrocybe pediades]|uniref:Uncharacterized protein n=1 Tax=Agrocybe pediades TaxID=84607 RepID=A0A8H4QFI5_9AGAR|nr:hypothetical protein D9613_010620 [Agrocybe pediades]